MEKDKNFAILIDGDNIPSKYIKEMMEEILIHLIQKVEVVEELDKLEMIPLIWMVVMV